MLHDHILHFAVPAQHGDAEGRIKNHKVFIRQPTAKVPAQQRQNPVFGVDHRAKHHITLFKADELNILAGFIIDRPFQVKRRTDIRVPCCTRGSGAFFKADTRKAQQDQFMFRVIR